MAGLIVWWVYPVVDIDSMIIAFNKIGGLHSASAEWSKFYYWVYKFKYFVYKYISQI